MPRGNQTYRAHSTTGKAQLKNYKPGSLRPQKTREKKALEKKNTDIKTVVEPTETENPLIDPKTLPNDLEKLKEIKLKTDIEDKDISNQDRKGNLVTRASVVGLMRERQELSLIHI